MIPDAPRVQVVARRWKYAAPPWRVYDALAEERDRWLEPGDGEQTPGIAEVVVNERVVFGPWVDYDIGHVEVLIAEDTGRYGARLDVIAYADHGLSPDRRRQVRHRLGTVFGKALRDWVDGL